MKIRKLNSSVYLFYLLPHRKVYLSFFKILFFFKIRFLVFKIEKKLHDHPYLARLDTAYSLFKLSINSDSIAFSIYFLWFLVKGWIIKSSRRECGIVSRKNDSLLFVGFKYLFFEVYLLKSLPMSLFSNDSKFSNLMKKIYEN